MRRVRLKIDISGTLGDEAWGSLRPFAEVKSAHFGPGQGSSGPCRHAPSEQHSPGEWWGAVITVEANFLADYALPHYLEQARVLDAFIEDVFIEDACIENGGDHAP